MIMPCNWCESRRAELYVRSKSLGSGMAICQVCYDNADNDYEVTDTADTLTYLPYRED